MTWLFYLVKKEAQDCFTPISTRSNVKPRQLPMADLREGPGPPLFLVRKEEITERRNARRVSKTKPTPPPPPLAQGLDSPVNTNAFDTQMNIAI